MIHPAGPGRGEAWKSVCRRCARLIISQDHNSSQPQTVWHCAASLSGGRPMYAFSARAWGPCGPDATLFRTQPDPTE